MMPPPCPRPQPDTAAATPCSPSRWALVALLVAAPAAMAGVFTPESGGSPNADDIETLYKIVLYVAIPIFLLVEGTLIWSLVKFRARRGGPEPAQIRGNTPARARLDGRRGR